MGKEKNEKEELADSMISISGVKSKEFRNSNNKWVASCGALYDTSKRERVEEWQITTDAIFTPLESSPNRNELRADVQDSKSLIQSSPSIHPAIIKPTSQLMKRQKNKSAKSEILHFS